MRYHTNSDNLLQIICQIIAGYFEDDCADELAHDSVMTAVLDKQALASQLTLSRFWRRMDGNTLKQFQRIDQKMHMAIIHCCVTMV